MSAPAFLTAARLGRIVACLLAPVALLFGLSGCSAFCGDFDPDDYVRVSADETVSVTEVCMLERCVTETVLPFASEVKIFDFADLARSAKEESTSITVNYTRNGVPETWESKVTPMTSLPNGNGCDPVRYAFDVRLT